MVDVVNDSAEQAAPCTMVIFGASGDLTVRKLIPGLFELHGRGLLPERFAVLGAGRTAMSDEQFRGKMAAALGDGSEARPRAETERFLAALHYQQLDTAAAAEYGKLAARLDSIAAAAGTGGNVLFYLATPPSLFEPIAGGLAGAGMAAEREGAWRRLIVEKPFGYDLESAHVLNERLHTWFTERQIYRIDHYLGKETVQNVLVLRFANEVWEPLWNRATIDRVEITAAEQVGVEGRGGYYDESGALRDMVQNHLLQVVGMIAMEPPAHFLPSAVRNETVKVFDSLRPIAPSQVAAQVVRGQYTGSLTTGGAMAGYREEPGVPPDSRTETYVALRFYIDNRRWAGVPFLVRTGKRLPARVTEVVIHFKQVPHHLFGTPPPELIAGEAYPPSPPQDTVSAAAAAASKLIIRIQPDEAIQLRCNVKLPGRRLRRAPGGAGLPLRRPGRHLPAGRLRTAAPGLHHGRRHPVRPCRRHRVVLGVRAADPDRLARAARNPAARLPRRKLGPGRRLQPVLAPRVTAGAPRCPRSPIPAAASSCDPRSAAGTPQGCMSIRATVN